MATRASGGMRDIEWAECLLEPERDRAMERLARRELGMVPADMPYLIGCPWLARASVRFHQRLAVRLDTHLNDVVALVVSHENSCRFCYATVRALMRVQGMSEARMQALETRLDGAEDDARTRAVIAFARQMARGAPLVTAADCERLEKVGFDPEETREISFVVAYMVFGNRLTTIPAIPPFELERVTRRWTFPLLRPLMARVLGRFLRGGHPEPVAAAPVYFTGLIGAYAGSPIAGGLSALMADAWESPILSRRAKALMFGVVARGLGDRAAIAEAERMLSDAGVPAETSARALAHLRAPELPDSENALLGFARDTIWYQPAGIQRRARAIRDALPRAEFLEAVGVAALANGVCRLSAALLP